MAETEHLLNAREIDKALKRLNARMVYGEVAPVEIVVCGGAALIVSDLMDLEPTEVEVKAAVSWLLGRAVSPQFKATLRQVLDRIGHERIAGQI